MTISPLHPLLALIGILASACVSPPSAPRVFMTIDELPDGIIVEAADTSSVVLEKLKGLFSSYPASDGSKIPLANYNTSVVGDRSPSAPATVQQFDWFFWREASSSGQLTLSPYLGLMAAKRDQQLLRLTIHGSFWHILPEYEWVIDPRNPSPPPGIVQDAYVASARDLSIASISTYSVEADGALRDVGATLDTAESVGRLALSRLSNVVLGRWAVALSSGLVSETVHPVTLIPGRTISLPAPSRLAITLAIEEIASDRITVRYGSNDKYVLRPAMWAILDSRTAVELAELGGAPSSAKLRVLTIREDLLRETPIRVRFDSALGAKKNDNGAVADLLRVASERYALIDRIMSELYDHVASRQPSVAREVGITREYILGAGAHAIRSLEEGRLLEYDQWRKTVLDAIAKLGATLNPEDKKASHLLSLGTIAGHTKHVEMTEAQEAAMRRERDRLAARAKTRQLAQQLVDSPALPVLPE